KNMPLVKSSVKINLLFAPDPRTVTDDVVEAAAFLTKVEVVPVRLPLPSDPVPHCKVIAGASVELPSPYSILKYTGAVDCNVSANARISYPAKVLIAPGFVTDVQSIWPVSAVLSRPTAVI